MAGRWVAGIVHHDSYDDLEVCLAALTRQTHAPAAVRVVDTGADPERYRALERAHPGVHFERVPNRGYGAGANRVLAQVARHEPDAEFVLILNADVELDPPFAALLLAAMDARPRVALASGKLLRPGRTHLDSAGITLPRHRRPRDRGSEQLDRGQFDRPESIFAVSGAALLLRRAALADLDVRGEIFDEDFFAYHDDTDLAWRAHNLGWDVLYEPAAQAVHGRRWRREHRMQIGPQVRQHSFKNHYLEIIKNERAGDLLRNLPVLLVWEILRLGYALTRDRAVLPGYWAAAREAPRAFRKRRAIHRKLRGRGDVGQEVQ